MKGKKEYIIVNKRQIMIKDHIGTRYAYLEIDTILGSISFRKKLVEKMMAIQKKLVEELKHRMKKKIRSSVGNRIFFSFPFPLDEYWNFRNQIVDLLKDENNFYDEPSVDEIVEEASARLAKRKENEMQEDFLDRIRPPDFKWQVLRMRRWG